MLSKCFLYSFTLLILSTQVSPFNNHWPSNLEEPTFNKEGSLIIPLKNKQNTGYYFVMRAGDPVHNNVFEILLDISNPWTWLPDISCSNCFRTNIHSTYYDCKIYKETCFQDFKHGGIPLSYPFGFIIAVGGSDLIGFQSLPLNASINHTLGFAIEVHSTFYDIDADGIFGLGIPEKGSHSHLDSILNSLFNQKWIDKRVFSLFLTHNPDKEDVKSELQFGGYNPKRIAENETLQIAKVANHSFWSFKLNSLKMKTDKADAIDVKITPNKTALLSTVFPDIGVPFEEFKSIIDIFKELKLSCSETRFFSNYICSCPDSDLSIFPDLEFEVDDAKISLPSHVYMSILGKDVKDGDGNVVYKKYLNCVLGFRKIIENQINEKFENSWIFGMHVMRYYYTIFDMDQMTISFAPAKGSNLTENLTFPDLMWVQVLVLLFLAGTCLWLVFKCFLISRRLKRKELDSRSARYSSMS